MIWTRGYEKKGTEFSEYSDDFYLDETHTLRLKDIPKNDQELIDSYFSTRLEAILDMYSDILEMPNKYQVDFDPAIVEIDSRRSDLERCLEADRILDDYRNSDPENADLSRSDLVMKMKSRYLESVNAFKAQKGINDETQNQQKVEQENVYENGSDSEE